MRSLWAQWPQLHQAIAHADYLALFLDFDGTLVPIARHPAHVHLPNATRHLLQQLQQLPRMSVALVSGRALRDVQACVGLERLYYVGNHGLEIAGSSLRYVHPAAWRHRKLLRQVARDLRLAVRSIRGAWVEDKRYTLSLHWRLVPTSAHRLLHRRVGQVLASPLRKQAIRVTRGKRVIDIRPPVNWHKGDAALRLLRHVSRMSRGVRLLPIYVGDDQTDEDAFRLLRRTGLTLRVGHPAQRSAAQYYVENPQGVLRFLRRLRQMRLAHD